jgi:hypothetical protein
VASLRTTPPPPPVGWPPPPVLSGAAQRGKRTRITTSGFTLTVPSIAE